MRNLPLCLWFAVVLSHSSLVAQGEVSIYGRITEAGTGVPLGGVRMNGLPNTPYTNTNGEYAMLVTVGWSGTVTPFLEGYNFSPASRTYSNVTTMQADQDYVGTPFAGVSGTITDSRSGAPLGGVRMNGLPNTPYTNTDGFYAQQIPLGWSGTVTPFLSGYDFSPVSRTYSNVTMQQTAQDYVGTPFASVSGTITDSQTGVPLGGVRMDGLPSTPYTNTDGLYAIQVPLGWSGTVTPFLDDYTFSPASRTYTAVEAMQADQDYVGTPLQAYYSIYGTITVVSTGAPLSGVKMSGLIDTPLTDKSGFYAAGVRSGWSGTVAPVLSGYDFTPASRTYSNVTSEQPHQDYTASPLAIPAPTLLSPIDKSTAVPITTVLHWRPVNGADQYRVQVSSDSLFESGAVSDTSISDTSLQVKGLLPATRHFWRARAGNSVAVGPFCSAWSFTTILSAPQLFSPTNESSGQPTTVELKWTTADGATLYHLQLTGDSTFRSTLTVNDSTVADTGRSVSGLLHNTRYYWRVGGRNADAIGEFSSAWSFATVLGLPEKVQLLTPSPGTNLTESMVAFAWRRPTSGATRYWLEVATDSLFVGHVSDSSIVDTFSVRQISASGMYWWKVGARNESGWGPFSDIRSFTVSMTGVADASDIPLKCCLFQNYPNPFNPSTLIRYGLPHKSAVSLTVFNTLGQQVASIIQGEREAGYHEVRFDATDMASGIYLYRLQAGDFVQTRKWLLIR